MKGLPCQTHTLLASVAAFSAFGDFGGFFSWASTSARVWSTTSVFIMVAGLCGTKVWSQSPAKGRDSSTIIGPRRATNNVNQAIAAILSPSKLPL